MATRRTQSVSVPRRREKNTLKVEDLVQRILQTNHRLPRKCEMPPREGKTIDYECKKEQQRYQQNYSVLDTDRFKRLYSDTGEQLGQGNFARLQKGVQIKTGKYVALKLIRVVPGCIKAVTREHAALNVARHKHVIPLIDVLASEDTVCMVMALGDGDLLQLVQKSPKGLNRRTCLHLFSQLCKAVLHIHMLGIVHRDIKLENILVSENMHVQLADFGCAGFICGGNQLFSFCGSFNYMSPEMHNASIHQKVGYDYSTDAWSLGIVLYALCEGSIPFEGNTIQNLAKAVIVSAYPPPERTDKDVAVLIGLLLEKDVKKRMKAIDIWKASCWYGIDGLNLYFRKSDVVRNLAPWPKVIDSRIVMLMERIHLGGSWAITLKLAGLTRKMDKITHSENVLCSWYNHLKIAYG